MSDARLRFAALCTPKACRLNEARLLHYGSMHQSQDAVVTVPPIRRQAVPTPPQAPELEKPARPEATSFVFLLVSLFLFDTYLNIHTYTSLKEKSFFSLLSFSILLHLSWFVLVCFRVGAVLKEGPCLHGSSSNYLQEE